VLLASPVPTGDPQIGVYIALLALGFLIGTIGHIVRSSALVAVGIGLIFLGVIVLPLLAHGGGE
jgi:hypothetical protein